MSSSHGYTHEVVVDLGGRAAGDDAASRLRDRMRELLNQGYECVLLNVAELTYIDSVLLGAVVQAHASAIQYGARLRIVHATRRFRELLAVTKLDRVLDVIEDRAKD